MNSKLKKTLAIAACAGMCVAFAGCGDVTLEGDPQTYANPDNTVSIDLPATSEETWTINEEASSAVLDVMHSSRSVDVQIQCVTKAQAEPVAADFEAYADYSLRKWQPDFMKDVQVANCDVAAPEWAKDSQIEEFKGEADGRDVKGIRAYLASDRCFYTVLVIATADTFAGNKKAIEQTIATVKEIK